MHAVRARQCTAVCLVVYGSAAVRVWQCGSVRQGARLCAILNNRFIIINKYDNGRPHAAAECLAHAADAGTK